MRGKIAVVVSLVLLCAGSLLADEVLLGQIYGTGVHAFNEGDYVGAYNALTSAIKGGSNDPRAYYFRGLAYLRLGRDDEAKADFAKGAELEVADSVNEYPVNRSLERIQGKPRQLLESYRLNVHAVAVQRQEAARQARYEQRAAAEQDVLRRVAPAQLPAGPARPIPSAPAAEKAVNPFEPAAEPAPAKPAVEVEKNPFEPAPKPAEKPAAEAPGTNPFGEPTPPATKAGGEADPFGGPAAQTPPQTMPKPTPAESGDPFGNPVPAPATEKPAEPAANPFGADTTDKSKTVQPTEGGIGSLFHAFVAGSGTPPAEGPASAPPIGFEDFVTKIMGGSAMPIGATPPVGGPDGGVPNPGNGGVPAPGVPTPGVTQPAADPFGAAAPAPAVPAPNGGAMPQPAPATPVPPPAGDNDPFK